MKKVIFAAMALGLPVMAGEPAPIVTPAPAPSCPLTLEVAGVYKSAAKELLSYGPAKEIDVMGADLTLVKPLCGNSAVTLRFGYNFGDEAQRGVFGGTEEVDVHSFYLMPGYRYTHALTEKTALYGAVNAGIANTSFKYKFDDAEEIDKWHDSDWGFIATLELGVRYQLCEKTELFAAYEFTANYAKSDGCDEQTYNGVRVGMGFKF
ncbi:MAG: outer membrane beta-barrel protein [Oscillospiraceae bacterium]|nr:outer membrane beta-barrel protein [Oscillospiraceae bacterium]